MNQQHSSPSPSGDMAGQNRITVLFPPNINQSFDPNIAMSPVLFSPQHLKPSNAAPSAALRHWRVDPVVSSSATRSTSRSSGPCCRQFHRRGEELLEEGVKSSWGCRMTPNEDDLAQLLWLLEAMVFDFYCKVNFLWRLLIKLHFVDMSC